MKNKNNKISSSISCREFIKHYDRYVFVKEPWIWYGRNSILVSVEFDKLYDIIGNKKENICYRACIYCISIDDFHMYRIIEVQDENEFKK